MWGKKIGTILMPVKNGPHREKRLSAKFVPVAPPGRHTDGGGLYLVVDISGARRWLLRLSVKGRRRDFGLGSAKVISLAEAREKAFEYRKMIAKGIDPILERKRKIEKTITFKKAAEEVHKFQILESGRNGKHKDQWINTLIKYAYPKIGDLSVDDISSRHILQILQPIWLSKHETARRVLQRLKVIFDYCIVNETRLGSNPTTGIEAGLKKAKKKVQHFKAVPHNDLTELMQNLKKEKGVGAKALRFTILTAMRSGPVRFAEWQEFEDEQIYDLETSNWTVPDHKMKADEAFKVPIVEDAFKILKEIRNENNPGPFVFPSPSNPQKPISDATMRKVLQKFHPTATVHGMRRAFREWAEEEAVSVRREVKEKSLAHTNPDKVESAYLGSDYYEERRELLAVWSRWIACPYDYEIHLKDYNNSINIQDYI